MKKVEISPSLLSADFLHLDEDLKKLKANNISYLHFDVMDGIFVNNISFGIPVLKSISSKYNFINDVHLMIINPRKFYKAFIEAGANIITFHYEAIENDEEVFSLIQDIKKEGCKVGISIKPATLVQKIEKFIKYLDLVLIMSVEPGFGGQAFQETALEKINFLKNYAESHSFNELLISVDGGINDKTANKVIEAGANLLVSGSYIFNAENISENINKLLCQ